MAEFNHDFRSGADFALVPQLLEIRITLRHSFDELRIPGVCNVLSIVSAKDGQEALDEMRPIDGQAAQFLLGKREGDQVAFLIRDLLEIYEYVGGGGIPSDNMAVTVGDNCRAIFQLLQNFMERRVDHGILLFNPIRVKTAVRRQVKQVLTLVCVQSKRSGNRIEDGGRHLDIPALLQPGIPRRTYPSELGDFLAPQTRCPSARTCRQTYRMGMQFGALCF
ncbi:hypothetical protein D3C81_1227480 [compost metagenome]